VILVGAEEEDVRAWFLHAPAAADHAGVPTIVIDAIHVSCDYRPSRLTGRLTPQRPLIPGPICRLAPAAPQPSVEERNNLQVTSSKPTRTLNGSEIRHLLGGIDVA
jgi:hypothetical protein